MFWLFYFLTLIIAFIVYSYGFIDLNLHVSTNPTIGYLLKPLSDLVFLHRPLAALIFVILIGGLYIFYFLILRAKEYTRIIPIKISSFFLLTSVLFLLTFPAFTYDIFNYILTAKVTYYYHENPYVVMPVEIPNEPMLAYTRAANKFALYGPTWIGFTLVPHLLGANNIVRTVFSFKLFNVIFYLLMLRLIYLLTKDMRQVLFFGLNPLVLVEVLVSSHNDIFMMLLALWGLSVARSVNKQKRLMGYVSYVLSIFVKGATIVLLPLFFWKRPDMEKIYRYAYWLMFAVFLLTPLREELYPWYSLWFLTFASVIPIKNRSFIHGLTVTITLGLSFRHLPYIFMGVYEGYGPLARILITVVPVTIYLMWRLRSVDIKKIHIFS